MLRWELVNMALVVRTVAHMAVICLNSHMIRPTLFGIDPILEADCKLLDRFELVIAGLIKHQIDFDFNILDFNF